MVFIVFINPQMMNMPGPDNLVVAVRDVSFCHPVPIYLSRAFLFALKRNSFKKARTNGSIFLAVVGVVFQSVIPIRKKKNNEKQ